MSLCKPNCITGLPDFGAIDDCDINALLSSGAIAKIILPRCDLNIVDVDDPAEWTTNLTNADISIPFVGNGKIDEQQESGEVPIGCEMVPTICKKPFEYISYITDTAAQTDTALYNSILAQRLGLSVAFLTCDGILLIDPDWTTGNPIGIDKSSFKVSQIFPGDIDSKMYYKITGELTDCRSLKRVKLSAATITALSGGAGSGGGGI